MGTSAVIITLNEARHIAECIASVRFCDEVLVVDSGSTDGTPELAREAGARVMARPFDDFASQKNFAVSQAGREWILSLDADERVSAELAAEIPRTLAAAAPQTAAYRMPRWNFIFGRRMRFGGGGGDRPVRLFRREGTRFHGIVHETAVFGGATEDLRNPIRHYSTPDAASYMRKLNAYTTLEARLLKERGAGFKGSDLALRPLGRFLQRYVAQAGFLEGHTGLVFALLSAYYEAVRYFKFWEILRPLSDRMMPRDTTRVLEK